MSTHAQTQAHFVVVGAGGLGCPALVGLTSAGARTITIVDHDRVEASNLQRQVLYSVADVGRRKVDAASWSLTRRIPQLQLTTFAQRIEPADVDAFVDALSAEAIILECTDSPALKFAFNDAALRHGVPLVIGAALGLHGQCLSVVRGAACYRCIYEHPPANVPTCEAAGVLGVAVGLAGFTMAAFAMALAHRASRHTSSEPVHETAGILTAIDSAGARVQTLAPKPRPNCPACAAAGPLRFPRSEAITA